MERYSTLRNGVAACVSSHLQIPVSEITTPTGLG